MRIGIVVDAACDLPADFIATHGIEVMPIRVRIGPTELDDRRDEQATLAFLRSDAARHAASAQTSAPSIEQIRSLLLQRLAVDYDHVFCTTLSRTRSLLFEHARQASLEVREDCKPLRQEAGYTTPFTVQVIDSRNLFAAQAVLAAEAIRLRATGAGALAIHQRMEALIGQLHGYLVPRSLCHLRTRARAKGEHSIGLFTAALGSLLDLRPILHCHDGRTETTTRIMGFEPAAEHLFNHLARQVRHGLAAPVLCVSYGGELAELQALPGYRELRLSCREHEVQLHETVMSLAGIVNVGCGALAVGIAALAPAQGLA